MIPTNSITRQQLSDRPQIVYSLLCDPEGRLIAVEVFSGNTSGPKALTQIVTPVCKRFSNTDVVFVGDRGMITARRIKEDLRIRTALRGSQRFARMVFSRW